MGVIDENIKKLKRDILFWRLALFVGLSSVTYLFYEGFPSGSGLILYSVVAFLLNILPPKFQAKWMEVSNADFLKAIYEEKIAADRLYAFLKATDFASMYKYKLKDFLEDKNKATKGVISDTPEGSFCVADLIALRKINQNTLLI